MSDSGLFCASIYTTDLSLTRPCIVSFLPPAPLSLCVNDGFDMRNDEAMCPTERSALQKIYDAAKGREWTEDTDESTKVAWLDEYGSHCDWLGITCDSSGHVRKLNLTNNGLSGKLSESIGDLTFLEVLDLRDNDIKVSCPLSGLNSSSYFALIFLDHPRDLSATGIDSIRDRITSQPQPFVP